MGDEEHFFDFAAEVGLTKHVGGREATEELIELCHVGAGSYVLDVGCGVGQTPCFIARTYGARVMGIDLSERMVERSGERARREGLADRTDFRVADGQDLPFEDGLFDAVITESVAAFLEDKPRGLREFARVTRSGGFVGLNESTWLKVPPPPDVVAWIGQDLGGMVNPLTADEWARLLAGAGLTDLIVRERPVDLQTETKGLLSRYGCRGMVRVAGRMLALYARNPAYRRFVRQVRQTGLTPEDLDEYFGYGLYVGRKPGPDSGSEEA